MLTSNSYDSEFNEIFTLKPRRYSVSMMRSQREEVLKVLREKEPRWIKAVVGRLILITKSIYMLDK